jgi:hypothetical protein
VGVRLGWIFVVAACHHGSAPASAPTCGAAADHVRSLLGPDRARAVKIGEVFGRRCEADAWSAEARSCVVATTSLRTPRHCKALLTGEQRAALDRALEVIAATPSTAWTPPACNDYRTALATLTDCPAIPPAARVALEQAYRQLVLAWARGTYDTGKLEAQCASMLDGLHQAMAATCGR